MTQQYTDYQMFRNTYAFLEHIQYTRIRYLSFNIKINNILYDYAGGIFGYFYLFSHMFALMIFNILGYVAAYNIPLEGKILYYLAYLLSSASVFILLAPWLIKLLHICLLKHLKSQFNKHLIGLGLQGFVQLFLNDKYSPTVMRERQFYHELIIAHHENKKYLPIALSIVDKYYRYAYDTLHKENQQEIFNNFFETSK